MKMHRIRCSDYWYKDLLELNITETKEMKLDFKTKHKVSQDSVIIKGEHASHADKCLKPRLYCIPKVHSFNINPHICLMLYLLLSVLCTAYYVGEGGTSKTTHLNDVNVTIKKPQSYNYKKSAIIWISLQDKCTY